MSIIVQKVSDFFNYLEEAGDPRVKDWFLMGSPWPTLAIITAYWYFVFHLGPRIMKNRQPIDLKKVMIVYNAMQVIFAAYLVEEAFRVLWLTDDYNFYCIEVDYSTTPRGIQRARTVWLFYMTKMLDLLDTVFFVLRKKTSHVSFLHVYHHSLVFGFGYMIVKYFAGGHIAFFGTINAFVHCIMYSYYLYTALYPGSGVWWKKYLTQLQLIQFFVTGVHGLIAMFDSSCKFPKPLIAFGIPQDILMIVLFAQFYRKAYSSVKTSHPKSNGTEATAITNGKKAD